MNRLKPNVARCFERMEHRLHWYSRMLGNWGFWYQTLWFYSGLFLKPFSVRGRH